MGSSEARRSAEWGGSSRSWLQPSSAGAGAAGLRLRCWLYDELREARCALSRVALHRWREPLLPAQGALLTSADAEEDAVFGSVTLVLQLSLFSLSLALSKFSKDPLVSYKKSKISFFLIP